MINNPLVSIIIVNWNGRKWLENCLDSLYHQTYKNFEIIFVDNASTDDSVAFILEKYPHIFLVKNRTNLGFSVGNNIGIQKANGAYILFLNNDTWVETDFLDKMLSSFIDSNYDIMGPTSADYYSKEYRKYSIHLDPFGHFIYLFGKNKRQESFYLSGFCLLFKKSSYLRSGGFDNNFFMYAEECDWFWRLHLLKMNIYQNDEIVVYHAKGGSTDSGMKPSTFLWRNQNTLQMLLKNYALYNLIWVLPIYLIINFFEIFVFLLILKPKIALSYIEGWWFNVKNFKKIMEKRRWIQNNRKASDFEVMKNMYIGFSKLNHLTSYIKNK